MIPTRVPDGLGRDGTPVGLNGRRSISFQALWRSIHHQKWIPLQRYLNIRPSSAAAISITAYLLIHPSGRSLKEGQAWVSKGSITHQATHTHTSTPLFILHLQADRVQ